MQIKDLALSYINNISSFPGNLELQDIIITENTAITSVLDGNAVISRGKNITINSGATWSLTNRCQRWDIIVNGNLTVNGTISMNSKGINRASDILCQIFGFYGSGGSLPVVVGAKIDEDTSFNWKHKEFTVAAGGQPGDGGILNIYVKGNVNIGADGVISANGDTGKNGGTVHIYYTGTFVNTGSVTANGGSGGVAGVITIEDFSYDVTDNQKALVGDYIYCLTPVLSPDGTYSGKAFLGTRTGGKVYYTENWGTSWTDQGQLGTSSCVRCFLDFGNGTILAGTGDRTVANAKIYKTTNYGILWTLLATLGIEERVCCICNLGGGVLLAGTRNGGLVYKSTDYGENWVSKGIIGSGETLVRSFCNLGGGVVLAGTKAGIIYKSTNSGDTWTAKATLTSGQKVRDMIYLGSGVVLAGDQAGKVWMSTNSGDKWTLKTTFRTKQEIAEFKRVLGNKVFVSTSPTKTTETDTQRHLAVSEDGGLTWCRIPRFSSTTTNSFGKKSQNIFFQKIPTDLINIPINHFGPT